MVTIAVGKRHAERPILCVSKVLIAGRSLASVMKNLTFPTVLVHAFKLGLRAGPDLTGAPHAGMASMTEKKLPSTGVTSCRTKPASPNKAAYSCSVRSLPPTVTMTSRSTNRCGWPTG